MYSLKVYKVNDVNGGDDTLLFNARSATLAPLLKQVKGNALGLGKITILEHIQHSYDEIMIVGKTQKGDLVDFVFYKDESDIKKELTEILGKF